MHGLLLAEHVWLVLVLRGAELALVRRDLRRLHLVAGVVGDEALARGAVTTAGVSVGRVAGSLVDGEQDGGTLLDGQIFEGLAWLVVEGAEGRGRGDRGQYILV